LKKNTLLLPQHPRLHDRPPQHLNHRHRNTIPQQPHPPHPTLRQHKILQKPLNQTSILLSNLPIILLLINPLNKQPLIILHLLSLNSLQSNIIIRITSHQSRENIRSRQNIRLTPNSPVLILVFLKSYLTSSQTIISLSNNAATVFNTDIFLSYYSRIPRAKNEAAHRFCHSIVIIELIANKKTLAVPSVITILKDLIAVN
jgi:hypothetical protein